MTLAATLRLPALVRGARSPFVRGVALLSSGQLAATVIPLLAAPVISRLYTPAEYGPLAAYMGFSSVLGSIAALSYNQAIVAERRERAARALIAVSFLISVMMGALALLLALTLIALDGADADGALGPFLLALPLSVVLTGLGLVTTEYGVRTARFGLLAQRRVAAAVLPVVVTIALGFVGFGATGLIVAYLLGQVFSFVLTIRLLAGIPRRDLMPSWRRIRALLRSHRDFVRYATPTNFLTAAFEQLPVFALTTLGLPAVLGAFVRARQLVLLPLALLGGSIGQVFCSHAVKLSRHGERWDRLYDRTLAMLVLLALPGTVVLWLFAPAVVTVYLGPDWAATGDLVRLMAPLLFFRFVASPLGSVFNIIGHQRLAFTLRLVVGAVTTVATVAAVALGAGADVVLSTYIVGYSVLCVLTVVAGRTIVRAGGGASEAARAVRPG